MILTRTCGLYYQNYPIYTFSLVTVPDRNSKQLLAIDHEGLIIKNGVDEFSNKVFLWDEEKKWTTSYPNMPPA